MWHLPKFLLSWGGCVCFAAIVVIGVGFDGVICL